MEKRKSRETKKGYLGYCVVHLTNIGEMEGHWGYMKGESAEKKEEMKKKNRNTRSGFAVDLICCACLIFRKETRKRNRTEQKPAP